MLIELSNGEFCQAYYDLYLFLFDSMFNCVLISV